VANSLEWIVGGDDGLLQSKLGVTSESGLCKTKDISFKNTIHSQSSSDFTIPAARIQSLKFPHRYPQKSESYPKNESHRKLQPTFVEKSLHKIPPLLFLLLE
jgi:hypothetical protein